MTVVAAVIERDGKILIGQRRASSRHAFKWEFPGGKVEPGETPEQALKRELQEELEIEAEIGPLLDSYRVQYPGGVALDLRFYHVTKFERLPVNRDFEQIQWSEKGKLKSYDFLDGDLKFLERFTGE